MTERIDIIHTTYTPTVGGLEAYTRRHFIRGVCGHENSLRHSERVGVAMMVFDGDVCVAFHS